MGDNREVDSAFKVVVPGRGAFHIWRIEKFELVAVPKDQHGTFFTGDSYLVYASKGDGATPYVHFWIGNESTADEGGVAAYKAVELDDYLGGAAVQQREIQNHESSKFLSYFRKGIKYRSGGVKSGLTHVDRDQIDPRLYHIKGKRYPRCTQVPLKWSSFNDGDAFVLDMGAAIFVWKGKEARRAESTKAMAVARGLRDDRGKADLINVESGKENEMTDAEKDLWGQVLPLSQRSVAHASAAGSDDTHESQKTSQIKLYRVSDSGGSLTVTETAEGPLKYEMLDSNDVFIVDNGASGVYVWVGKGASKAERSESMKNAINFVKKKGYPDATPVTRIVDHGETEEFKVLFNSWPPPKYSGKTYSTSKIAHNVQTKFDVATMHDNPAMARDFKMVDDGSGRVEIWRIENFQMVPVDKRTFGQFYGGDSYVILYTYRYNNRENHIIYYWLGRKSSADEQGTAALSAVKLDDKFNGEPVQVRVVQGKEPPHFMAIFEGKLVIYDGGKSGWNKEEKDRVIGESYLLRVHGTQALNTKAVQVPLRAASLNSNDVFVLKTKTAVFVWSGKGCTGDEREMGKRIASSITSRAPELVMESQEKDNFWQALGGKEEYASFKRLQDENPAHAARLFHGSNDKGYFYVEPVPDFIQDDLDPDDVMILDTWDQIFIWIGNDSNQEEKSKAEETAINYIKTDPSGRDVDEISIIKVKQGFEPPTFTGFFPNWDFQLWSQGKTYSELSKEFGNLKVGPTEVNKDKFVNGSNGDSNGGGFNAVTKYSYEELVNGDLDTIRPDSKEIYLSDEEFQRVFKMAYKDFVGLPRWKQIELKKAKRLF